MDIGVWLVNHWQWLAGFIVAIMGVWIAYLAYRKAQKPEPNSKVKAKDNAKVAIVDAKDQARVDIDQ